MKKTILHFALALVLLCTITAGAAGETEIFADSKVTLSGSTDKNAAVSITVLKKGVTLEEFNLSSNPETLCLCYRQTVSDEKGAYSVSFDIGTLSSEYNVYTGVSGKDKPEYSLLKYVNKDENALALANLSSAFDKETDEEKYSEFESVVKNKMYALGLNSDLIGAANLEDAAKIFFASVKKDGVTTYETAKTAIDKSAAISLSNEGKIMVTGTNTVKSFSLPESVGKYLEKSYIDDETRAFIEEKISKPSNSFGEFDKSAAQAVGLGVIYSSDGAGGVKSYLTENANLLNIDSAKVTDAFAESIVGKKFNKISEIGLDSFIEEEKPIYSGGSSSSGGGSKVSGSAIGGISPIIPEPIDKTSGAFSDLQGYEWAQNAINTLREKGILNGKANGIFAPSDLVLREEFLKMMLTAVTFEDLSGSMSFEDVGEDDWYYQYVKKAYIAGIVNGVSDKIFGSGRAVSRQDMAVMCYNALLKKGIINGVGEVNLTFADKDSISSYAREAVSYLGSIKIVNGDDTGRFNPESTATRAEAAQMIYNVIAYTENK